MVTCWKTRLLFSRILCLFLFLSAINVSICKEWSKENFPNPIKDTEMCGRRGVSSWICDPDEVLSYADANTLEEMLRNIEQKTTSGCEHSRKPGYQIAVALMKKIKHHYGISGEELARDFAVHLHDSWGVGHRGCGDGAVFLLSVTDRTMYISTGRVAKEVLTSDQIGIIFDEMKPFLRSEKYGRAVHLGVERMGEVFSGKMLTSGSLLGVILIIGFFIFMAAIVGYSFYKQRRYETCQRKLQIIENERNAAKGKKRYESKSCPICLEEFTPETPTRLLVCGHKYCEPCLSRWLENNTTCPICRKPTSRNDDELGSQTLDFMPELAFRLRTLQMLYPSIISQDMIHHWTVGHYGGSFISDPMFCEARPMFSGGEPGAFGSGSGFGGGGSSGGGGGGGSW